jgi:hypothetical protein
MMTATFMQRRASCASLLLLATVLTSARSAGAQAYERDPDDVPTGARRAAEWKPTREGLVGTPWTFAADVGVAFYSGDDAIDNAGISAEARLTREIASDFYAVGSYFLGFIATDVTDPDTGRGDRDTHVVNVPTLGLGWRGEVSPEIHLFVEPRVGVLFGNGMDTAPAAGLGAGVDIQIEPGFNFHVAFTGLATDTDFSTRAGDAHLSAIWAVGVGLAWEF